MNFIFLLSISYDPIKDDWTELAPMVSARYRSSAVVLERNLIVIGKIVILLVIRNLPNLLEGKIMLYPRDLYSTQNLTHYKQLLKP